MKKKYFVLASIILLFALNVVSVEEVEAAGTPECFYGSSPGYSAMGGTTCASLGLKTTGASKYGDGWVYCDDFSDWSRNKPNRTCTAPDPTPAPTPTPTPTPTPDPVNGSCNSTKDTCSVGSFSDDADTTDEYKWSCSGSNGGIEATCSSPKPCTYISDVTDWGTCTSNEVQSADEVAWSTDYSVSPSSAACANLNVSTSRSCSSDGSCGRADEDRGGPYTVSEPTSRLCSGGESGNVTGNSADGYKWKCNGIFTSSKDVSCKTPPAECSNGKDDDLDKGWDYEGFSSTDPDCSSPSDNNESGILGASVSCVFPGDSNYYKTTEEISLLARVFGGSGDITYEWSGDFITGPGPGNINKSFDTEGDKTANVKAYLNGQLIGQIDCENSLGDKWIRVSDAPGISFNIPIGIANESNQCQASYSISEGSPVNCNIMTDQNESVKEINTNGTAVGSTTIDVNVGNDYRLECEPVSATSTIEIDPTNFYECRKPNLIET